MHFHKKNRYIAMMCIAALLVTLLSITSFGRYETIVVKDVGFNIKPLSTINILDSDKTLVAGNEIQWDTTDKLKTFYITPYYGDTNQITLTEDTSVLVWVFIPDTVDIYSGLGNLEITLLDGDMNKTYIGKGEFISSNTPLYKEKGAGWLYRFYDSNNSERVLTIHGDEPKEVKVKIELLNDSVDKITTIGVQYTDKQEGADSK